MKATTTKKQKATTPGFALVIEDDTPLDGILMIELTVPGQHPYNKPVAAVASVNEAREIAASYKDTYAGKGTFRLWARGLEGEYIAVPLPIK